jgi:hypothetical protein
VANVAAEEKAAARWRTCHVLIRPNSNTGGAARRYAHKKSVRDSHAPRIWQTYLDCEFELNAIRADQKGKHPRCCSI